MGKAKHKIKTRAMVPMIDDAVLMGNGTGGMPGANPDLAGLYGWWPGNVETLVEHIGAAERCEQLACQQLASLALRQRPHEAQWRAWLANPDPAHLNGLTDAIWQIAWSLYRHGEAFLWATSRYWDTYPASWVVLDPVSMDVELIGGELTFASNGLPLDNRDVLWIRRNPIPGRRGTGVLQSYWSAMRSSWASERHAANVLDGSGVPAAVIKHAQRLTKEKAQDLQAEWVAAVRSRMGAPAVLSEGLDFSILSWSPRDLMLLELREYDSKQIASAYGVPAFLLNLSQSGGLTYTNPTNLFRIWWQAELMPMGRRIEVGLSTWLPSGQSVSFDAQPLLRADFVATVNAWLAMLGAGAVTQSEFREAVLDLPPLSDETGSLELLDSGGPHDQNHSAVVPPRIPIETLPGSEDEVIA